MSYETTERKKHEKGEGYKVTQGNDVMAKRKTQRRRERRDARIASSNAKGTSSPGNDVATTETRREKKRERIQHNPDEDRGHD